MSRHARPPRSLRHGLRRDGPGASMMRAVFPAVVAGLVTLAVLRWLGEYGGLYSSTVGLALMTVASIGVIGGLLWSSARRLDRDEDARLAIEVQLLQSSRYFDLSRDLLCTSGFDGVFRQLNSAWTETLGWSEAELRSRPYVEFVHPDDRARTVRETAGLSRGARRLVHLKAPVAGHPGSPVKPARSPATRPGRTSTTRSDRSPVRSRRRARACVRRA